MPASSAHDLVLVASTSASVSDWFARHVSVLITSAIIIVVAVVANFIVRRAIGHAVERFASWRTSTG